MPAQIVPDNLGDYFPGSAYALVNSSTDETDPLRALLDGGNEYVRIYIAEVVRFRANTSVQTAVGYGLDYLGAEYGVPRYPSEVGVVGDNHYRGRILASIEGLTIAALTILADAYFVATAPAGVAPSTVTVWDLASDPTDAATIIVPEIGSGAERVGLKPGEFVVDIAGTVPVADVFFLDNAYFDNGYLCDIDGISTSGYEFWLDNCYFDVDYLIDPLLTVFPSPLEPGAMLRGYPDSGLAGIVGSKKGTGFRPLFRFSIAEFL